MPAPRLRSRSLKRSQRKLPGGGLKVHYRRKKAQKAHCAQCKKVLSGVPEGRPVKIKRLAKTERRPERPYGGVLCSPCTRALFKEKARSSDL